MKLLLTIALLTAGVAQAKSIPSLAECTVASRSTLWTGTTKVENTRITGQAAKNKAMKLSSAGASITPTVDVLGVTRFRTVELRTVLETNGTEVNSCEGVYYAVKSETCTADSAQTVCETFCKIEWLGEDCR